MEKKQRTLGKRYEAPEAEGIELVPCTDFVVYGNPTRQSTEDLDSDVVNGEW